MDKICGFLVRILIFFTFSKGVYLFYTNVFLHQIFYTNFFQIIFFQISKFGVKRKILDVKQIGVKKSKILV